MEKDKGEENENNCILKFPELFVINISVNIA
jgi:hypothetical protein